MSRTLLLSLLAALSACVPAEEPPVSGASLPIVKTDAGIEMVLVPEGEFEMGSARGRDVEQPVHKVRIDAFLMDRTEVTQEPRSSTRSSSCPTPRGSRGRPFPSR
jgi:formylglycine-generating enzyme required for sulfatase activity